MILPGRLLIHNKTQAIVYRIETKDKIKILETATRKVSEITLAEYNKGVGEYDKKKMAKRQRFV